MLKKIKPDLHHLQTENIPTDCDLSPVVIDRNYMQRHTSDAYEQACSLTAWQQLYDQLESGRFRGELTEILFDGIQFYREYTSLSLRQSCMVWPGAFWFGIPGASGETGSIGRKTIGAREIAVCPGGKEFELSTPNEYYIHGVVLSHGALEKHASMFQNSERMFEMLSGTSALTVQSRKREDISRYIQQTLAWYGQCEPDQRHHPQVGKVISHNLMTSMVSMLEDAHPVAEDKAASRIGYEALIRKARNYPFEQQSEPVTVLDLCNALKVSRRTLQNAFRQTLGIGPNAWLKIIRLNAVRRELISPYSQQKTVTDAAMQWGFWHLSQFAIDYRRLFKENPSETLNRRLGVRASDIAVPRGCLGRRPEPVSAAPMRP
ncbi:MAG: HTH-type transcriptional regulator EutR [Telmatospirillum sp.]|nr:HTH-type transcriptional regulator EutR [Telmatospirillum sp.]